MEEPFSEKIRENNKLFEGILRLSRDELLKYNIGEHKWKESEFSLTSFLRFEKHLVQNRKFIEMYNQSIKHLNAEFIDKAVEENQPHVYMMIILCFYLSKLLTDAISRYNSDDSTIFFDIVQDIYGWYRRKRKILLRRRIGESEDFQSLRVEDECEKENKDLLREVAESNFHIDDEDISSKDIPAVLSREKKKRMFISNKLKQYGSKDLSLFLKRGGYEGGDDKRSRDHMKKTEKELKRQKEIESKKRKWNVGQKESKMSEFLQSLEKKKSRRRIEDKPKVLHHWIRHRAREAQERLEDFEFKETVAKWSRNRARIEEEIQRRQESLRYASQTGVNVHKILRKTPESKKSKAKRTEHPFLSQQQQASKMSSKSESTTTSKRRKKKKEDDDEEEEEEIEGEGEDDTDELKEDSEDDEFMEKKKKKKSRKKKKKKKDEEGDNDEDPKSRFNKDPFLDLDDFSSDDEESDIPFSGRKLEKLSAEEKDQKENKKD